MASVHPNTLLAISTGIQSEVASYVFYMEAMKKVDDDELKAMLAKLAIEEKQHFHLLEKQHQSLVKSEKWISTADALKADGLPEVSEDMSSEHRDLIELVEVAGSVSEILDIAFRLEEDAFHLFSREAERTDSMDAKEIFTSLAKMEKGHMGIIQDWKKKLN